MKHPKKQNNSSIQISHTQASFYSGKLPPPEMMAKYNAVDPTFANRILSMAEAEQKHVHQIEKIQLKTSILMAWLGMLCGVVALSVLAYLLYYAIDKENTNVAIAISTILVSVVAVFVVRNRKKTQPNIES